MSQGSFSPNIRFLVEKVCSVKVKTEDTLSGFQDFFLQPIIKDRSKKNKKLSYFYLKRAEKNYDGYIGPLLDDRLKENLKNPETLKGCPLYSLSCLSVCLSVCL